MTANLHPIFSSILKRFEAQAKTNFRQVATTQTGRFRFHRDLIHGAQMAIRHYKLHAAGEFVLACNCRGCEAWRAKQS